MQQQTSTFDLEFDQNEIKTRRYHTWKKIKIVMQISIKPVYY